MSERNPQHIFSRCTQFLTHYPMTPQAMLNALAESAPPDQLRDMYGMGPIVEEFEAEIATLLGKEAAVFMPTGTMAQQIALRIWSERKGSPHVAFHPTCHLEKHESMAYRHLHGLDSTLVGSPTQLMTLEQLKAVPVRLSALLIELPQREIGGHLPGWEELVEITTWAREQGIALHMDGARLWESAPFYERDYAEIAGLFDSVYVSFYKILQGIAGAALAGSADFIAEARLWRARHGGKLAAFYPLVLGAKWGLERNLPNMAAYHKKAKAIAGALAVLPEVYINPSPPHTNMFHLSVKGDPEALFEAGLAVSEESGVWLGFRYRPSEIPGFSIAEIVIGAAGLDLEAHQVADLFGRILALARGE